MPLDWISPTNPPVEPARWSYSYDPSGVATATFPGIVNFTGGMSVPAATMGVGDQLNHANPFVFNVLDGSVGAPITTVTPGSTMTVSRYQSIPGSPTNPNNPNAAFSNSALSVFVQADANDKWLANALAGYAFSSSVISGTEVPPGTAASQGGTFKAEIDGASNRRAIGLYSVGVKNGTGATADAWGTELSAWNLGSAGVSADPLLLDQVAPGSYGAGIGVVVNSRYGVGFVGAVQPVTCGIRFQTGDNVSAWQNCIWISTAAQMDAGIGIYDNASAPHGTLFYVGGQRQYVLDASAMITTTVLAYEKWPNSALLPSPTLVLGQNTAYFSATFGSNFGAQFLGCPTSGNGNTASELHGMWSADALGASVFAYKSRATTIGGHAIAVTGDHIWEVNGFADDGVTEKQAGRLRLTATGTLGAGFVPGLWAFQAANSAGTLVQTLLVDAAGFRSPPRAFASLPAPSAALEGTVAAVTNSTTATWGAVIAGGGANHVLAYCDGTNWTVMGV